MAKILKNNLNYISVKDLFWIQFNDRFISFGFKELPINQHFTLSFNADSNMNFHITKNTPNPKIKPKISILTISKEALKSNFESFFLRMFMNSLRPIDVNELENNNNVKFISFLELDRDDLYSEVQKKLFGSFKNISKVKQAKKIKINEKWENQLVEFVTSKEMIELVDRNTFKFNSKPQNDVEGGIMLTNDNFFYALKIRNEWYEYDSDIKITDLFSGILDKKLISLIWWRIRRSIIYLKYEEVKTYNDVKHLNIPIELFIKEEDLL